MDEGGGVLAEHRDVWHLLDGHQRPGEVLRELERVSERPGNGIDVDHGHGLAPFAPGYAGVTWAVRSQPLTETPICSAAVAISCATSVACETIAT